MSTVFMWNPRISTQFHKYLIYCLINISTGTQRTSLAVHWLTLCSQCRGPGFDPRSGNKIPHAVTKTQHSQIIFFLKHSMILIIKKWRVNSVNYVTWNFNFFMALYVDAYNFLLLYPHQSPLLQKRYCPDKRSRSIQIIRINIQSVITGKVKWRSRKWKIFETVLFNTYLYESQYKGVERQVKVNELYNESRL